ncbi:MAG: hypothetical protein CVV02_15245 [Firmicutes bacterium HGW-Firmicutes-7]|nr:MAG: hypothetical protein CVV02_15245 [Firmicutes bacterium HGW-Firmicutes-7]
MKIKKIKYLKLRYLRQKINVTQIDFSKLIGISRSHYSKKENGVQGWGLDECEIIRDYINKELLKKGESPLTIDEIFYGEEVSNKTQRVG